MNRFDEINTNSYVPIHVILILCKILIFTHASLSDVCMAGKEKLAL